MHIVNAGDVSLMGEHTPPSPHVGLHVGYVPLQVIGKHPDCPKSSVPQAKPFGQPGALHAQPTGPG